jgi:hypothetical protein
LVERLVHACSCHCFLIDHEELEELGFPVRPVTPPEDSVLEVIAAALSEAKSEPQRVITLLAERNQSQA